MSYIFLNIANLRLLMQTCISWILSLFKDSRYENLLSLIICFTQIDFFIIYPIAVERKLNKVVCNSKSLETNYVVSFLLK